MTSFNFRHRTYGKWILTGEHTVLRGGAAIVFPLKPFWIELSYVKTKEASLSFSFLGPYGQDLKAFFLQVFRFALNLVEKPMSEVTGHVEIESHLPLGSGVGGSAALSMLISRFFVYLGFIARDDNFVFAKKIEDLFHGESSGLDLAGTEGTGGVLFKRPNQRSVFTPLWSPFLLLTDCGEKGMTSDCINKVKTWIKQFPDRSSLVDSKMNSATEKAMKSLCSFSLSSQERQSLLVQAFHEARECFHEWGLMTQALLNHEEDLLARGALATKPTGSGGGGHMLSLWSSWGVNLASLPSSYTKIDMDFSEQSES